MAYCLINKSNYFYNLSKIEERIDKDKIAVVIKNNAYGHGLREIAGLSSKYGVKHAVVNNLAEAQIVSNLFETIANCLYQIWEGEEVHDAMDYAMKDKLAFIDSLNHEQFEKIQNFFETMPTLKHEVHITNPKTKKKSTVTLSGMNDFF